MLWPTRKLAMPAALELGLDVWRALVDPNPRALAAIMRGGTPVLPLLAKALHRHLRELPSSINGLSFTQQMALQLMAEGEMNLASLCGRLTYELDPLPGQGDFQVRDRLLNMEGASARLYEHRPGVTHNGGPRPPWTDVLTITDLGRAVLKGDIDLLSLKPPKRWVGGVEVGPGMLDWRWDEERKDGVLIETCVNGLQLSPSRTVHYAAARWMEK